MSIGITIRQLRIQKRFSQSTLANLVGVSQGTISNWESDVYQPNTLEITQIAAALGVSTSFFLPEAALSPAPSVTQENARLHAQIEQLTQQLANVIGIVSRQQELLATFVQKEHL